MRKVLITIILTYYQKRKYIKKTINSVKKQTYKNIQFICVYDDNNKKDLKFIKQLVKNFKKKIMIINKKNQGVANSRNIAIKYAKGKYIAFIDADDIWKKNKLKYQLNQMIKINSDISFTSYNIIDENDRFRGKRVVPKKISYNSLSKRCEIGLSSVLVKTNILKENKFPNLKTQEDFGLWLKLIRKGYIFQPINKVLMSWRRAENSLSSNIIQKILDAFKLFYKYENKNFISSLYSVVILSVKKILN